MAGCCWRALQIALSQPEPKMHSVLFPVTHSKLQPLTSCLHGDPKSNKAMGHFRKKEHLRKGHSESLPGSHWKTSKSLNSIKTHLTWWHSDVTGCNRPTAWKSGSILLKTWMDQAVARHRAILFLVYSLSHDSRFASFTKNAKCYLHTDRLIDLYQRKVFSYLLLHCIYWTWSEISAVVTGFKLQIFYKCIQG